MTAIGVFIRVSLYSSSVNQPLDHPNKKCETVRFCVKKVFSNIHKVKYDLQRIICFTPRNFRILFFLKSMSNENIPHFVFRDCVNQIELFETFRHIIFKKLSWNDHPYKVASKACEGLGLFRRTNVIVHKNEMPHLYKSRFRLTLEFGLLFLACPININPTNNVQKSTSVYRKP